MLATMQSSRSRRRRAVHGFTLPELLISMAILAILTLALFMLFRSSLSAYKSTKKSMEANEETHTAFRVLQRDLVQNYAAKHYGDSANFFGCPYGMTMICTMQAAAEYRSARVSYVVHSTAGGKYVDTLDGELPTFGLIRYIEPGVGTLSEYPVDWPDYTDATAPVEAPWANLWQELRNVYLAFGPTGVTPVPPDRLEAMMQAKKHELWITMLGGRQEPYGLLPDVWNIIGQDPEDYVIAEGVVQAKWESKFPSEYPLASLPGDPVVYDVEPLSDVIWFSYGYTPRDVPDVPGFPGEPDLSRVGEVQLVPYWNAVDRANLADPGDINYPFINLYGSPLYPYPPSLVATNFGLAFRSPNLGERHYTRRLAYTFQIPVGYRRPTLE